MFNNSSTVKKYEHLPERDSEFADEKTPASSQPRFVQQRWFTCLIIALGIAFAFMLGIVTMHYIGPDSAACSAPLAHATQIEHFEHHCGDTLEEAIASGCEFDYLSGLWLPKVCSRSYEAEFLEMPGTGFYGAPGADLDDSIGRNVTSLPFGTPYYTTRLHHVTHCLFLWLRNNDDKDGVPIAANAMGLRHQSHCATMILGMLGKGPKALWEVAVRGDIYRQSC
ncbi:hypothetical protein SUNI508_02890 [Seiridium unicorne]|uniref:Uncharacterized protein n=1 Tax=Seiridium unicorne TaxID=138068 RepID=A0ABR2VIX8_9PEZI